MRTLKDVIVTTRADRIAYEATKKLVANENREALLALETFKKIFQPLITE